MDELINRSKKGDEEAFTELILSIKNDLYKKASTYMVFFLNKEYHICENLDTYFNLFLVAPEL